MSFALKEGAGGKQFPFGRWNRDQGHRLERLHVGSGYWFECICGEQGMVRQSGEEADTDAEAHERAVFERARSGQRFVRGRWQ